MGWRILTGRRGDAFAVRRRVFQEEQGYVQEFDAVDDDPRCVHVALYAADEARGSGSDAVTGELAGCARVFPEEVERALEPGAPQAPAWPAEAGKDGAEAPEDLPCDSLPSGTPGDSSRCVGAEPASYLLGRVAVLPAFRNRGCAARLIGAAEDAARAAGARVMKLHAQEQAQGLYARQGYRPISPVDYEDEGQPHLWMAKLL